MFEKNNIKPEIVERMMKHAIFIAKKNVGKTSPNPTVGCIITDKYNNIISKGVTGIGGRPHAEQVAISKLSATNRELAHNLFVTLEPCCYSSSGNETCVNLIKNTKMRNVYIGLLDPNPKITSRSLSMLNLLSINTQIGVCKQEIFEMYFGFVKKHFLEMPEISYKIATSLDGKISCRNFHSKWITNEKSREFTHKIRNQCEAILTTNSTVEHDNPEFTVRHIKRCCQPTLIVLDKNLRLLQNLKSYKIFDTERKDFNRRKVIILHSSTVQIIDNLKISLPHLSFLYVENFELKNVFLEITRNFGFSKILIEAGGKLLTSSLQENLIDVLYWFHGSKIIGNDGIPAVDNLFLDCLEDNFNFELQKIRRFGDDSLSVFHNKKAFTSLKDETFSRL